MSKGGTNVPSKRQAEEHKSITTIKHFKHRPYSCDFGSISYREEEIEDTE